jgi:hypothetical protein
MQARRWLVDRTQGRSSNTALVAADHGSASLECCGRCLAMHRRSSRCQTAAATGHDFFDNVGLPQVLLEECVQFPERDQVHPVVEIHVPCARHHDQLLRLGRQLVCLFAELA